MNTQLRFGKSAAAIAAVVFALAGCASMGSGELSVALAGDQEVPPVKTAATGTATIKVGDDKSVTVTVKTVGLAAIAAHIHSGAAGTNGPVIVPFTKVDDNTWTAAPGAKFTDAQYELYKAGNTYVNVHSAANKGGEIRGQIRP
jgi:hypothetical protein